MMDQMRLRMSVVSIHYLLIYFSLLVMKQIQWLCRSVLANMPINFQLISDELFVRCRRRRIDRVYEHLYRPILYV